MARMALRAAMRSFVPMLVLAGESDSFGEDPNVDPGVQWLDQLADVGGPDTLANTLRQVGHQGTQSDCPPDDPLSCLSPGPGTARRSGGGHGVHGTLIHFGPFLT